MELGAYRGSDYASMIAGKLHIYYGSQEIDEETEEWCFVVKKNGKEVFRRTNTQLSEYTPEDSPLGMLVAGLTLYLAK